MADNKFGAPASPAAMGLTVNRGNPSPLGEPVTNPTEAPGLELSALFVNRFHVLAGPLVTRIVFGETVVGPTSKFHTAIVMSTFDAKQLAEVITKVIEANSRQVATQLAEKRP